MPIDETYRIWKARICELRPKQRITQVQNFVLLVVGNYHSHTVNLSRIAGKELGEAKNATTVGRLSRFLPREAIDVRCLYKPVAKARSATTNLARLRCSGRSKSSIGSMYCVRAATAGCGGTRK
jgi:hypothetical protein